MFGIRLSMDSEIYFPGFFHMLLIVPEQKTITSKTDLSYVTYGLGRTKIIEIAKKARKFLTRL